jgi:hypothetical protein
MVLNLERRFAMRRTNMKCTAITVLILIGALSSGCATTTKSSTTLGISQRVSEKLT